MQRRHNAGASAGADAAPMPPTPAARLGRRPLSTPATPASNTDVDDRIPGDSWGLFVTRQPFCYPLQPREAPETTALLRRVLVPEPEPSAESEPPNADTNVADSGAAKNEASEPTDGDGDDAPTDHPPELCVNPDLIRWLCARFALAPEEAWALCVRARGDHNLALWALERRWRREGKDPFGLGAAAAAAAAAARTAAAGEAPVPGGTTEGPSATNNETNNDDSTNNNNGNKEDDAEGLTLPSLLPFGSYSLTALELYRPECFALCRFSLPSFLATRSPDVLAALHEAALCVAEAPGDTVANAARAFGSGGRRALLDAVLADDFFCEGSGTSDNGSEALADSEEGGAAAPAPLTVRSLLASHGVALADALQLPLGEYGSHGFYVRHAASDTAAGGFPNIGTGVAAAVLDLRAGIHTRFRFHAERIADTVSEHACKELVHFGQKGAHILRQPFWWAPTHSVEEYIRFKESLLQPSALVFELRYAVLAGPAGSPLPVFRNVAPLEEIKIAQHKFQKQYTENTRPGVSFSSEGAKLSVAHTAAGSSGGGMQMHTNPGRGLSAKTSLRDHGGFETKAFLQHGTVGYDERLWDGKYYKDNFH